MQNGFEIYTKKGRVSKTPRILSNNRTFSAKTGGLESLLKYAFKLIFLKCIFEFMINTAPTTSNSVHGREKCFKCNNNYFSVTKMLSRIPNPREVILLNFLHFFLFSFDHFLSLWLVSLYSLCWSFKALRGFCDNV